MKPVLLDLASAARRLTARLVLFVAPLLLAAPAVRAQTLSRAMWIWETTPITNTTERTALVNFCMSKGVTTVFVSTGNALIPSTDPSYAGKPAVTNAQLGDFCIALHSASPSIQVWAVDGDPGFCLTSNHPRVLDRLDKARVFNYNQASNARLDGFQWDIEPHGLSSWTPADATTKNNYLAGLVTIARSVNTTAHTSQPGRLNLSVGFVIPFWYDNTEYTFVSNGATKKAAFHLYDAMKTSSGNHIAIMAYRDTAAASFPLAQGELDYAKFGAVNVKTWYGQETKPVTPTYVTFHEEKTIGLETAISQLGSTFFPAYRPPNADLIAGIAIHAHSYHRLW